MSSPGARLFCCGPPYLLFLVNLSPCHELAPCTIRLRDGQTPKKYEETILLASMLRHITQQPAMPPSICKQCVRCEKLYSEGQQKRWSDINLTGCPQPITPMTCLRMQEPARTLNRARSEHKSKHWPTQARDDARDEERELEPLTTGQYDKMSNHTQMPRAKRCNPDHRCSAKAAHIFPASDIDREP